MVVFQCDGCGETIKKPKAEQHVMTCRFCRALVCLDCMKRFTDDAYKEHTSCISEAQKYQGALYKPKDKKKNPQQQKKQQQQDKKQSENKVETKGQDKIPQGVKRPRDQTPSEPATTETTTSPTTTTKTTTKATKSSKDEAPKKCEPKKKMRPSTELVDALASTMRDSRRDGETDDELCERAQKMLQRALKRARTKLADEP